MDAFQGIRAAWAWLAGHEGLFLRPFSDPQRLDLTPALIPCGVCILLCTIIFTLSAFGSHLLWPEGYADDRKETHTRSGKRADC